MAFSASEIQFAGVDFDIDSGIDVVSIRARPSTLLQIQIPSPVARYLLAATFYLSRSVEPLNTKDSRADVTFCFVGFL